MSALSDFNVAAACSVPYLKLWGVVAGGWQMARAALNASAHVDVETGDADFYDAKLATAAFYAQHVLSQARWLARQVIDGSSAVMRLRDEQFDADRAAKVG
jgi:butyryl-CoA dehydrogenase